MFRVNEENQSIVKDFLLKMINYYNEQGKIEDKDLTRLLRLDNVSDNFLKAIHK